MSNLESELPSLSISSITSIKNRIQVHIVVGLSFGDEGKGSIVDVLTRHFSAGVIVRFNGGPQAAHHVVRSDGHVHCFSQFGAGSFASCPSPGSHRKVESFLSRFMLLEPIGLEMEADVLLRAGLSSPMKRLRIDARCVLVTPFHRSLNRLQELLRGMGRHGSCGLGVGQAWLDHQKGALSIFAEDVENHAVLQKKLSILQGIKLDEARKLMGSRTPSDAIVEVMGDLQERDLVLQLTEAYREILLESGVRIVRGDSLESALASPKVTIFEGAQGVLLDANRGFWPHVTPSNTSFENALSLLNDWGISVDSRLRWGVFRAYITRHGAGPLPTEDQVLTRRLPELHNTLNAWQGEFRVGWFDGLLACLALQITGPLERVVVTNLDRLAGIDSLKICVAYRLSKNSEIFRDGSLQLEDLCQFTESEDEFLISNLSHTREADQKRQGNMTRLLRVCHPVYETFAGWPKDSTVLDGEFHPNAQCFLEALALVSGIEEISLVSFGPSAEEKCFL